MHQLKWGVDKDMALTHNKYFLLRERDNFCRVSVFIDNIEYDIRYEVNGNWHTVYAPKEDGKTNFMPGN